MGVNPININVYWVLIGYPIRPNYDPSIISTNHPTLKYCKTTKNDQNTPKKDQNIPETQKKTKTPLKPKKMTKILSKPKN